MSDLNCNVILKEGPDVLSWNNDIYMFHYKQRQEVKRTNMCLQMNLISIVLHGTKEILDHCSKMIVPYCTRRHFAAGLSTTGKSKPYVRQPVVACDGRLPSQRRTKRTLY